MEKQILLIALAIFSMLLLIMFDNIEFAYAVVFIDVDITDNANLIAQNGSFIVSLNTSTHIISFTSKSTHDVTTSTALVSAYPKADNSIHGLACSSTRCFVTATGLNAGNGHIVSLNIPSGAINQQFNINRANGFAGFSNGLAVLDSTIFFAKVCTTGEIGSSGSGDIDIALFSLDGDNMSGTPVQHTDCGANHPSGILSADAVPIVGAFTGRLPNNDPYYFAVRDGPSGTADQIKTVRLDILLTTLTSPLACSTTITGNAISSSNLIDFTKDRFYLIDKSDSGSSARFRSFIPSSCSTATSSVISVVGNDISITGMSINNGTEIYVASSTKVHAFSFTNNVLSNVELQSFNSGSTATGGIKYDKSLNDIFWNRGTHLRIVDLGIGDDTGPSTGIDCKLPENENILTCRLLREGNTGLSGSSLLINQSATNISCQVGILQCTQDEDGNFIPDNPDVKTNGVGYMLFAIAVGIFVAMLFVASRGQLTDIPTFVWFIGVIAIAGALTAFEFIDPTFLVISVVVVIALAVAKAKSVFSGSELFKGESV